MPDSFRATIDELAMEYNRRAQQVHDLHRELNELRCTSKSRDGMVGVTLGARGQVYAIELNPRVHRTLSATELAAAIMEQIAQATAQATARAEELIRPLLPDDLPNEEIFGPGMTLDSLLPQPLDLGVDAPPRR
ncbi:YbaB/EbfC family DNA-binding protein [Nonomuraea deserti]|uniref:YbaB/EbfC family DNA-binding protein n=1 Tax=Nonomuraea deserti TaxID=1848322 RepID=A0A4R4VMD5_9ACTN|nr:YbaB/EbfC family nucleoid-associated protein [Nonomuraea deserti]TDD06978.1 YbaB/EbfC family DNA-binding protein [Nonomuraea deserti]